MLDSIGVEIQTTMAGVLILLFVTLLEIINLKSAKKQHQTELHEMSVTKVAGQRKRLISLFSLTLHFIFGFAAFGLFVYGMMYFIIIGKMGLAVVAGVSAFIAVMMPFIVWSLARSANKERDELIDRIQRQRHGSTSEDRAHVIPASLAEKISTVEKPSVAEPSVTERVAAAAAQTAPDAKKEIREISQVSREVFPKPDPAHVFPEDSMLRRHFMANLIASAKPYQPSRPTDSMLKRHYDAMLAGETVTGSRKQPATTVSEPAKVCRKSVGKLILPEDSMLRRHFLTTMRAKIESSLVLPSRPTDSMLRRHFDAMTEEMIASRLRRYLEG